MKDKIIYVNNKPIKVTSEIYKVYWQEREKEKYQNKLYRKNISSLDIVYGEQEFNPLELKFLREQENTKNDNPNKKYEELVKVLFELKPDEIDLIIAIYFEEMNQTELAKINKVSQQYISKKHRLIIKKIKKMINLSLDKM